MAMVEALNLTSRSDAAALLNAAPIAMAVFGANSVLNDANEAFFSTFGLDRDAINSRTFENLLSQPMGDDAVALGLRAGTQEVRLIRSGQVPFWAMVTIADVSSSGTSSRWLVQIISIDHLKEKQAKLEYTENIWRTAIAATKYGVWDYSVNSDKRFYSDGWREIRGIPLDEEVCHTREHWEARLHPDDVERMRAQVLEFHATDVDSFAYEYREMHRNGHYVWIYSRGRKVEWNPDGTIKRVIGADVDITAVKEEDARRAQDAERAYQKHLEALEAAQRATEAAREQASLMAKKDSLTNIANRRVFADRLEQLTNIATADTHSFAVLMIDLDRFKPVNDIHGHYVGDKVICEVARRLVGCAEPHDTVARIGGDEFGMIIDVQYKPDRHSYLRDLSERLATAIQAPINVQGRNLDVGASVGIALYPDDEKNAQDLMISADTALYHVKQGKRGTHVFYEPEMGQKRIYQSRLEREVVRAVRNREIQPHFQPIVDLKSGQVSGFEVLARWTHPEWGIVTPSEFIPIIQQCELFLDFGCYMMRHVCKVAHAWPDWVNISFNVSASGICNMEFPERMLRIMSEEKVSPRRFCFEVSERSLVSDVDKAKTVIDALRAAGMTVALDDFGVGYSGLSYLQHLNFDVLKLDGSFISAMADCPQSEKIVMSVLSLAKEFGMRTVAECIETPAALSKVRAAGFDAGQGFLFSPAISAEQATKMIASGVNFLPVHHLPVQSQA